MARTRNTARFDAQRGEILAAAAACFIRLGFNGASIADICAAAGGISPGRLYHYFPSKQAIVEALVAEERATVAALFAGLRLDRNPRQALLKLVREGVKLMVTDAHTVLALDISAESTRNPEVGRIIRYAERDYRERLIAVLAAVRQDGGGWAPGQDDRLARMVTMIIDGVAVRALIEPGSRRSLAEEAVSAVEAILDQARAT